MWGNIFGCQNLTIQTAGDMTGLTAVIGGAFILIIGLLSNKHVWFLKLLPAAWSVGNLRVTLEESKVTKQTHQDSLKNPVLVEIPLFDFFGSAND